MKIKMYVTKDCIICSRAKHLVESQDLEIEVIQANEFHVEVFREKGLRSFPILELDNKKYICGKETGEYLAMNIEELRKK